MFKVQYRNPQGRMVTVRHHDRDEIQRLANKAVAACPETHELRVRELAADEASGDFVWADCTAYFAPASDEDGTCPDCGESLDEDENGQSCPNRCDQV